MNPLSTFVVLSRLFAVPILLLNLFGIVAGAIWLAVIGKWDSIGYGILSLIVSNFALAVAMRPNVWIGAPADGFLQGGNRLGFYFFSALSTVYSLAVLAVWCVGVLFFFVRHSDANSIIPSLLWSYGVVTPPMIWLARKDEQGGGGPSATVCLFFAQVGYVISGLAVLIFHAPLGDVATLFAVIMGYCVIVLLRVQLALDPFSQPR